VRNTNVFIRKRKVNVKNVVVVVFVNMVDNDVLAKTVVVRVFVFIKDDEVDVKIVVVVKSAIIRE